MTAIQTFMPRAIDPRGLTVARVYFEAFDGVNMGDPKLQRIAAQMDDTYLPGAHFIEVDGQVMHFSIGYAHREGYPRTASVTATPTFRGMLLSVELSDDDDSRAIKSVLHDLAGALSVYVREHQP